MTKPSHLALMLTFVLPLLCSTARATDHEIKLDGKVLVTVNGKVFFRDRSLDEKGEIPRKADDLWVISDDLGKQILTSTDGRRRGHRLTYDKSGESKAVGKGDATHWRVTHTEMGTTIQVAEGKLEGLYLAPGPDKYELYGNDEKLHPVGWLAILTDKPVYLKLTVID